MRKFKELNKKIFAFLATGTIGLTSITGCAAKANTNQTTTNTTTATTTTIATTLEPTETTKTVEVTEDMASEDYMTHAKAVAKVMYSANKEYFDEKQYTIEDLENVYYVLNGKYYDSEKNIIMDKPELDRSFDIIRELSNPQRINELLQKYKDYQNGFITLEEYYKAVDESKIYNYSASLSNFVDDNEKNKDIKNFFKDYSDVLYTTTEKIKSGVSPESTLTTMFEKIRSAQNGDTTNYLQENTTKDGYAYAIAAMYKGTADYLNTLIDGQFITVKTKDGSERVRIGFNYKEQLLVNAYYLDEIDKLEDKLKVKENLIVKLFQTMPLDAMCYREERINRKFNYEPVKGNEKTYTYTK